MKGPSIGLGKPQDESGRPWITPEIIDWMERCWPDELPRDRTSPEDLAFLQGQQSVVRKVTELFWAQQNRS